MRKIDKQRIRSGYYARKRAQAYKQSAFLNAIIGLAFIFGGVMNEGKASGTGFMAIIGILIVLTMIQRVKK